MRAKLPVNLNFTLARRTMGHDRLNCSIFTSIQKLILAFLCNGSRYGQTNTAQCLFTGSHS